MTSDRPDGGVGPDLNVRFDYEWGTLAFGDLPDEPIAPLREWLAEAGEHMGADFNAMGLSTVDTAGRPSSRNVLLRDVTDSGEFWFFTNRSSHKGNDIASNPQVCLLFSWLPLHRQVRVDGAAHELDDEASDLYFAQRPRDSQIAAWASEQSSTLGDRGELEAAVDRFEERFEGAPVTRPGHWGGYAVTARSIEFWQGRSSRLHDRIRFSRTEPAAAWTKERLAP
ncbi:MAG: pyridoxamine 5'-phosphate oxidase [Microthrixaceae bacterium]